jgi:hypothetical protein
MKRLAGDLQYTGLSSDVDTLEHFIYGDLDKRLGRTSAHLRRRPLGESQARNTNTMKKVVRKSPVKRIVTQKVVRHCSSCGKAGYTKVNCSKGKQTKKVNYVHHDEVEEPEDSEEYIEKYIVKEEGDSKEEEVEEVEDDDEEYDDNESRNCYAVKKSGAKWSTYEKERCSIKKYIILENIIVKLQ